MSSGKLMKFLKEEVNIIQTIKLLIMLAGSLYFLWWSFKVLELLK